jgi:hypothetical protein
MHINDEKVLYKLLKGDKGGNISDSECSGNNDMNVKILSTSEHSPDNEENVSDMQMIHRQISALNDYTRKLR